MSFGLLGSIIPEINKNSILYIAPSNNLISGKVSISSKNYNPSKIRVGLTTDGIDIKYLHYNKSINYGETFESGLIYIGSNQRLLVRSTIPDVNFVLYGETSEDSANPVKSGLLGSVLSSNSTKKELFLCPQNANALVNLSICNLNSLPAKTRIGITSSLAIPFNSSHYIEYDVEIGPNESYNRNDLKLTADQAIIVSSSENSSVNFVCHGRLVYGEISDDNLTVIGNLRVDGNTGLGTFFARSKLDVIGNARVDGTLTVSGIITGIVTSTSLNQSLLNLGALPAIDGSALTGIVAQGGGGPGGITGIQIRDSGIPVGVATAINFAQNIKASFGLGIASVRLDDNVSIPGDIDALGNIRVATNKFVVNGSTGNVTATGSISANSTVSGNGINALNNRVTNVGTATSDTDATNKRYVDNRTIAISIALS